MKSRTKVTIVLAVLAVAVWGIVALEIVLLR